MSGARTDKEASGTRSPKMPKISGQAPTINSKMPNFQEIRNSRKLKKNATVVVKQHQEPRVIADEPEELTEDFKSPTQQYKGSFTKAATQIKKQVVHVDLPKEQEGNVF